MKKLANLLLSYHFTMEYDLMRREILAIILATIAFTLWGYFWYATLFDDIWQNYIGRSEEELINLAVQRGAIQHVFTVLISLLHVLGVFACLKWIRATNFLKYMGLSLVLSSLIVLPAIGNTTLFAGTPIQLLILDYGHFLFGYAGISFVFFIIAPLRDRRSSHSSSM